MSKFIKAVDYKDKFSMYETQNAISLVRKTFEEKLSSALNLKRVSAPLFVDSTTGLNDDLNGTERAVVFDIAETKTDAQVVHSLAKWKRMALHKYGYSVGEGLCTDMNAIRRDEEMDNLHSIYVDQWDWCKVIDKATRNIGYLKETAQLIVDAICDTNDVVKKAYPQLDLELSKDISFITTQELEDMYPTLAPKERETVYIKDHKTAFIMQIGGLLKSGVKHDGRAPDYDDWTLNGDIVFYNSVLDDAFEISSMGIRVDAETLEKQLKIAGCEQRKAFPFHKSLLDGTLPLTIGGGIGQSRMCMMLLQKAHIGEVQVSIWDKKTIAEAKKANINLL
ncbi:MAG: aspartate--ammonia ligase [Clostridia bacterium]